MTYKSPTNIKTYWNIVDTYWKDINHILNLYLPTFKNQWIDGSKLDCSLGEHIENLRKTQNPKIVRAFNAAWFNCPEESSGEWAHKSWGILCDLCSEEWCLHEEKEEELEESD